MIRKLRLKFVAAAMLSLLVVLAVILGAVNAWSWRGLIRDADEVLELLQKNGGRFPVEMRGEGIAPPERGDLEAWDAFARGEADPDDLEDGADDPEDPEPEEAPDPGVFGRRELLDRSPELAYETRFFSAVVAEDGTVSELDTEFIAAVDADEAASLARDAAARGNARGFSGIYRYSAAAVSGGTRVIFLDCSRDLGTFRSTLAASLAIAAAGLGAVFLLLVLTSRRITRPIAESYEKQKRFITDAGHELKTPLTIINADADVLETEVPDSEWLRDIRVQTGRLSDLTRDLIFLSRMDEENLRVEHIDFPLSDVVAETAQSFQALAVTRGKTFEIAVEPDLSLCGDEKAVRQLVSILLDNALKYSPEGGRIALSLRRAGGAAHLTVTNTAERVEKGDRDELFGRFYRADPARNSETGGYGLGLSIARAVVTAHRGRITARSEDGASLTVEAVLPER